MPLQHAQGQWAKDQNDNEWLIVDAKGFEIGRLPACLKDFEAMRVIHFGRGFEKKAYEQGLEMGRHLERTESARTLGQLNQENHRLQTQIEGLLLQQRLHAEKG
jgi:hypothetical protein